MSKIEQYQVALIHLKKWGVIALGEERWEFVYLWAKELQELVDRATPVGVKADKRANGLFETHCPKCGEFLLRTDDMIAKDPVSFCSRCGQALDWTKAPPKRENPFKVEKGENLGECPWCHKTIKEGDTATTWRGTHYHYDCFSDMCHEREAYEWQHE